MNSISVLGCTIVSAPVQVAGADPDVTRGTGRKGMGMCTHYAPYATGFRRLSPDEGIRVYRSDGETAFLLGVSPRPDGDRWPRAGRRKRARRTGCAPTRRPPRPRSPSVRGSQEAARAFVQCLLVPSGNSRPVSPSLTSCGMSQGTCLLYTS